VTEDGYYRVEVTSLDWRVALLFSHGRTRCSSRCRRNGFGPRIRNPRGSVGRSDAGKGRNLSEHRRQLCLAIRRRRMNHDPDESVASWRHEHNAVDACERWTVRGAPSNRPRQLHRRLTYEWPTGRSIRSCHGDLSTLTARRQPFHADPPEHRRPAKSGDDPSCTAGNAVHPTLHGVMRFNALFDHYPSAPTQCSAPHTNPRLESFIRTFRRTTWSQTRGHDRREADRSCGPTSSLTPDMYLQLCGKEGDGRGGCAGPRHTIRWRPYRAELVSCSTRDIGGGRRLSIRVCHQADARGLR